MQTFWLSVGFAYVFLGITNCILATRLRPLSPLVSSEQIKEAERELASKRASEPDDVLLLQTSKKASKLEESMLKSKKLARESDIALVGALYSLKDRDDKLKKGIDTNRWVLYLAALSLFIAAGISFVQGIGGI